LFPSNTLQGTTLRINEAFGVQVFHIVGFSPDSFLVPIDTASPHIWQRVYDSDSLMDEGALNTGKNIGVFNYGWGVYSGPPKHNVEGTKVFFFQLAPGVYKKVFIEQLDRDTAWDIKVANLDNSDLQLIHISKRLYPGKNFVYLNLLTNVVADKEPLSNSWDLQFLKYAATDVMSSKPAPVVGVWVNKGNTVARRSEVEVNDNNYSSLSFSPLMNEIGWNWKYAVNVQQFLSGKDLEQQSSYYAVKDSLSYFVRTSAGEVYKLIFTGYEGIANGVIRFQTQLLTPTKIAEFVTDESISVFPNPASTILNISPTSASVKVYNAEGQVLADLIGDSEFQVDVSAWKNGVYFAAVVSNGKTIVKRFVVVH
jgi:hypothetical protein